MESEDRPKRSWLHRMLALCAFSLFLCILLFPRLLSPAKEGLGTHQQMGLRPCNAIVYLGIPCPGCGGTTSFAHMSRGSFIEALRANVFGFMLYNFLCLWALDLLLLFIRGKSTITAWLLQNANLAIKIALGTLIIAWLIKLAL